MIGKLLAESGGAVVVARALVKVLGERRLEWAVLIAALVIGLPVFFQVGLVLLAPVLFTLVRETKDAFPAAGDPAARRTVGGTRAAFHHTRVRSQPSSGSGADPGRTLSTR